MKHSYTIANLDKKYTREAQVFTKAYLEAKGAECLLYHTPEGTKGAVHVDGVQAPEDMECVIMIGGDDAFIQATRDLAGRNTSMLGVNRGHLGCPNQVSRQEDIAPVLESLLNERYQLEQRMMIHGIAWWREEAPLKDITLNEIAITGKDLLKVLHYSVYANDEYLDEYAADGTLVATPTGSTAYNLSAGRLVIAPGARTMVLIPVRSHSLNAKSIVLAPENRVRIKVLNSNQVVPSDGDISMELKVGGCIDIRCSEPQIVMIKVKQISFTQNLSSHLGGIQTSGSTEHHRSARREASHMRIERHDKIVELAGKYEIETQEELAERLNRAGFNVTQATVSRGIRELKLTKIQLKSGKQCYMVLENPRGTSAVRYIYILKDGCMSMDTAQNILVIKTVSGMAMAVAAALDAIQFHEIVGCIAGDDTIICAIHSADDTIIVMEKIKKIMED